MNTLKNVVKKAIAVGGTFAMVGATVGVAAAADLSEYPAPFIKDGQFDGLIVVGEKAASSDIIGAIDIAASLQASATTPVSSGTGATRTELTGDVTKIGDSSDMLEIGEYMGAVTETLTDDDLEILKSGTITTQAGSTDFTQILDLSVGAATSGRVKLTENDDDETGVYLFFNDNEKVFTYELEFTSGLESDVASNTAEDLEDESIYMLGSWYSVSKAQRNGADNNIILELISGQVSDTLTVGETKTYTVDGKEYEITVLAIGNDGTAVKFLVNGESTDSMGDGDTDTLSDGLEIGVRDVIQTTAYRESDPGSIVEFYLGANKIEFRDSNMASGTNGGSVKINSETIEDATVEIAGTIDATDLTINSISYTLVSDAADGQDVFLAAGDGLRDALDESEGMIGGNWDIVFQGLSEPDTTAIDFEPNGDDEYELTFTNRRGDTFTVPYAFYNTNTNQAEWGDADDQFVFWELTTASNGSRVVPNIAGDYFIQLDDYVLVTDTDGSGTDNGDDTYVLQFSDVEESENTVTFTNVATGQEFKEKYTAGAISADPAAPSTGDVTIGGKDFDFWVYKAGAVYNMAVDQDNDGNYGSGVEGTAVIVDAVVRGGGILAPAAAADVPVVAGNSWVATLTTQTDDLDSATADQVTTITFTEDDAVDELDVSTVSGTDNAGTGNFFFNQKVKGEDRTLYVDVYGTWMEKTDETGEADSLNILYPVEQVEALVYVVGGEAQSMTTSTGGSGARVNPISVGSAVLDKDVTYDQDNMIVVGGPCVNTMAAQLLQNPADCAEGFEEGHAMIALFDTGRNTALLVAGYSAQDTVGASRVLAEYGDYDLSGMEVDVAVESLRNIRVNTE